MWARVVEVMLAVWLALSPFFFPESFQKTLFITTLWSTSFLLALFSLLSFASPLPKMHLLNIPLALLLLLLGFSTLLPPYSPAMQNSLLMGLILLMTALVPSHANQAPSSWNVNNTSDQF